MHCCCENDPSPPDDVTASSPSCSGPAGSLCGSWGRRFGGAIRWMIPITALALIPKCPACVAAYVLLFTGVGLSIPAAAAVRWLLIAMSAALLCGLLLQRALRTAAYRRLRDGLRTR